MNLIFARIYFFYARMTLLVLHFHNTFLTWCVLQTHVEGLGVFSIFDDLSFVTSKNPKDILNQNFQLSFGDNRTKQQNILTSAKFLCCPISLRSLFIMVFLKLNLERVVNMVPPPSPGEIRLCQRLVNLGLKDVFICMRKGVLLYQQIYQNRFTPGWCKYLRQLQKKATTVTANIHERE